MGVVKTRRCDVSQTSLNIKSYRVMLEEVNIISNDNDDDSDDMIERVESIIRRVIDLSPKSLKRLKSFIDRGTSSLEGVSRRQPPRDAHPTD